MNITFEDYFVKVEELVKNGYGMGLIFMIARALSRKGLFKVLLKLWKNALLFQKCNVKREEAGSLRKRNLTGVKHHHAERGGFSSPHITTEPTTPSELRSECIHPRRRAAWFSADFYKIAQKYLEVYEGVTE
ncbi:hypothetical protein M1N13_00120 [Dehalococcoidia bacterium]|nr:hypothetical protein [Dehalococcoidia bacterium]